MSNNHAELILYFGLCPSNGAYEIRFNEATYNSDKKTWWILYRAAREKVEMYLNPTWSAYGLRYGYDKFVDDEEEAKRFIEIAEKEFPNATGFNRIIDVMHGKVRFYRTIKFRGHTEDQRDELVEKLINSGIEIRLKPQHQELTEYDPERYNIEKTWEEALRFY